ncbi:alpha-ketoacid dehydrogenase subunit alpha/beta [Streptomyces tendae]|uniref:alpha-ketoacid dehydrogenase subunit alpha/beta n=1 Tax=Streptomyces tendae TaxID=1932 RepID=UPI0036782225
MNTRPLDHETAYRSMALIRRFEEQCLELSREGRVAGSIHLCLGQEAIPVGAVAGLQPQDRVLSTYRGHGWALASGSDPLAVMAEIAQRAAGVNGGRAGSPLLSDPEVGFLGENSIIGAGVPIADGVALAAKLQGTDRVVLTSIGDGAMNQGSTNEGMIFAAARRLPVIILCENNGWSEMTPTTQTVMHDDVAQRAEGMGIESHVVDGGDPFAVEAAVRSAAERCRRGEGPVFLECKTVRLSGHYNKDVQHYRPEEDVEAARAADPLTRFVEGAHLAGDEIEAIDESVSEQIAQIAAQVRDLPAPDPSTAQDHLYDVDHHVTQSAKPADPAKKMTYYRAVNTALKEALEERPEVVLYGEDVAFAGGIFGVTRGLQKTFGADRVFDTPIAESAILGSAVGAALEGMRPVVEIMWADFVFVALDQIINQAANVRYVSRSKLTAPLTIRMQQGVTPGSCAQHSQSIEAILTHIPGIKVGMPATPQDAYAMTRSAVEDPDPTVLIEHRSMYQDSAEVAIGGDIERAEGARVRREGADVAIITWGSMLQPSLAAAENLSAAGIEATVLDLRWLRPLDDAALARVVAAAGGRVIVVHEATLSSGFGAEVAARITESHFDRLAAPVTRIGTPEVRMPSAPVLQESLLPSSNDIVAAAHKLVGR